MKKSLRMVIMVTTVLLLPILGFTNTVQVGSGSVTSTNIPFNGSSNYNYSQQIQMQSMINQSGTIYKIRFLYFAGNAVAITGNKDWVIYMGQSARTFFSSTTDWVPVDSLTQVFAGDIFAAYPMIENNWIEITLNTPYTYNNIDNLIIAVDENSPGSGTMSWGSYNGSANTMLLARGSSDINPSAPPAANIRGNELNRLQLVFANTAAPLAPTYIYPLNSGWVLPGDRICWRHTPGLEGAGDADYYDVYFGTDPNPPLVSSNQLFTTYTPTLSSGTTYYWKIVAINEFGEAATPVWSFKTPTTTQLAEDFEVTPFPPSGWSAGSWTRTTGYSFHGIACVYRAGNATTQYTLSTPKLTITENSTLDYWSRCNNTNGYLQIMYSSDQTNWTQLGSNVTYSINNTFLHFVIDLSSLAGHNYYIGLRTGLVSANYWVDLIYGPEITPAVPGAPTLVTPTNGATNVSITPTLTWNAPTSGGTPVGYKVYMGLSNNPSDVVVDVNTLSFTIPEQYALEYGTTYYWSVSAYNIGGEGPKSEVYSFTTLSLVYAPQNVVITASGNNINLTWDAQSHANYYIIYGSVTPYGNYTPLAFSATNSYQFAANEYKSYFFKVVAATGEMPTGKSISHLPVLPVMANPSEDNRINK
jgi:hypothetical protein